jgi:hypothetical protein
MVRHGGIQLARHRHGQILFGFVVFIEYGAEYN